MRINVLGSFKHMIIKKSTLFFCWLIYYIVIKCFSNNVRTLENSPILLKYLSI